MAQDFHNNHKKHVYSNFHTSSLWTAQETFFIDTLKQKYNTQFVYQTHENNKGQTCDTQLLLISTTWRTYHCRHH